MADVANRLTRPELLAVDESMRAFVASYTGDQRNSRVRLMSLHQAVRGAAGRYAVFPYAEGSAREVFQQGWPIACPTPTCLSPWPVKRGSAPITSGWKCRPHWSRVSERVQVSLHVNVVVRLADGSRYMVDIDPPPRAISPARTS